MTEECVWNFAFGSNMASKVLKGRRNIKVLETVSGKVKNWRVSFFPMLPYFVRKTKIQKLKFFI